jgi:hypothetical protein
MARAKRVMSVGVWDRSKITPKKDSPLIPLAIKDEFDKDIINPKFQEIINNPVSGYNNIFKLEDPVNHEIRYFSGQIDPRFRQVVELEEIESVDGEPSVEYSREGKLKFTSKLTGVTYELDPVENINPALLRRYWGERETYEPYPGAGEITATRDYSTEFGCMYDNVYDQLTKIRQGRELSFKYSIKLLQSDRYREFSKAAREVFEGIDVWDRFLRRWIIIIQALPLLNPGLLFLFNPNLIVGLFLWSLIASPLIKRSYEGSKARELGAIEIQKGLIGRANQYWALDNEQNPPSFGQLALIRSDFEDVKWQYRSLLKNFSKEAKWDTNIFTSVVSKYWPKIAEPAPF